MEIKVTKRLNESTQIAVTAEGSNLQDGLFLLSPIINAPKVCGKCSSEKITVRCKYVTDGGYKFTDYFCEECGAHQPFGQFKAIEGCFFLKPWEDKYQAER